MDEGEIRRGDHLPRLAVQMHDVIAALGRIDGTQLEVRPTAAKPGLGSGEGR